MVEEGLTKVWSPAGAVIPYRIHRSPTRGGEVMFWASIINDALLGPFQVPKGFKRISKFSHGIKMSILPLGGTTWH